MFIHRISTISFVYILLTVHISARETEPELDVKIFQSNVHSLDSPVETSEHQINLVCLSACSSKAEFDWFLPSMYNGGLSNCSVMYSPTSNSLAKKQRAYPHMNTIGSFMLQGLQTDEEYSVQIKCGSIESEEVEFSVKESCNGRVQPEIKLRLATTCLTTAEFEWVIFQTNDTKEGLSSCNVLYGVTKHVFNNLPQVHFYQFMQNYGTLYISGLTKDEHYSVQISCASIKSDILNFTTGETECHDNNLQTTNTEENPVVVFKDQSSLFSTKDSILGIVFGLLGFLIIIVTTFYVLRKVRRRQRLQRIRRYLGTSLVDPFENLQNRITHDESGIERLMGSSDMV